MNPKKLNNVESCQQLLSELARFGLSEIVFCAGSRNAPFIASLGAVQNARIYSFFEERSAAFFALGRARALKAPVAVITTSGTAAAELLPACIEAFHSGVPLVLITADRPSRLRFTGAPQCIDQTKLMQGFVERTIELENSEFSADDWSLRAPLHINICLDDPLIDREILPWRLPIGPSVIAMKKLYWRDSLRDQFLEEIARAERPLIILGGIEDAIEMKACVKICRALGWPVYAEGCSGLRESHEINVLHGGEQMTSHLFKKLKFDLVLRLGSIPTTRLWRDLEDARGSVRVLSVSHLNFSGLSDSFFLRSSLADFAEQNFKPNEKTREWLRQISEFDQKQTEFNSRLFMKYPLSEPSLMRKISQFISKDELVYVGNSLPIREWDFAASPSHNCQVYANRGVNGIDGQLSSYFGLSATTAARSWCIVGDLTAMYDLASPWVMKNCVSSNHVIVIINNGGGKIFHRMYHNPLFENNHNLDFSHWANMWSLGYEKFEGEVGSGSRVVEVVPDANQTHNFWNELSEFTKTL